VPQAEALAHAELSSHGCLRPFLLASPLLEGAGITFLLWPVIGNTVCFVVALVADRACRLVARPTQG